MFAKIAAVLFGLALLLELLQESFGRLLTPTILTTAGLLCVALHLSGFGSTSWRRSSRRR
jgi:hypothetical protein